MSDSDIPTPEEIKNHDYQKSRDPLKKFLSGIRKELWSRKYPVKIRIPATMEQFQDEIVETLESKKWIVEYADDDEPNFSGVTYVSMISITPST